eukprot:COSAG02_NODE_81_length_39811_cov_51.728898_31_plen_131_part_00
MAGESTKTGTNRAICAPEQPSASAVTRLCVLPVLRMQWSKIRANSDWIIQFHSTDDPFIPPEEARHVAKSLQLHAHRPGVDNDDDVDSVTALPPPASGSSGSYYEFGNRSHFFREFDELIQVVGMKLGQL